MSINFRRKGALRTNTMLVSENYSRVIAFSSGGKISAVHCLVLSQSRRVTDRQTDGTTTANAALA